MLYTRYLCLPDGFVAPADYQMLLILIVNLKANQQGQTRQSVLAVIYQAIWSSIQHKRLFFQLPFSE